jgi:hypothetical protein
MSFPPASSDSLKEEEITDDHSDLNNNFASGCLGCLLVIGSLGTVIACMFNVVFMIRYLISLDPAYIRFGEEDWGMRMILFGILVTSASLLMLNGLGISCAQKTSDSLFYKYSFGAVLLMMAIDFLILFIRANFI